MTLEPSIWSFIINAGWVVKFVMLILLLASIMSWTIIIQRASLLKRTKQEAKDFDQTFWSGIDLNSLWQKTSRDKENLSGLHRLFHAGFSEYLRLEKTKTDKETIIEATQRAMRIAEAQEMENLERHLSILATVGSVSPYVGLFGTVWGIMTAFRSLVGTAAQATIAMVAPGISESLIATAMGLFAAIPAVIAYNRYNNELEQLQQNYAIFQEELVRILQRRLVQTATVAQDHFSKEKTQEIDFDDSLSPLLEN